ncbi:phospholipase domain-containing protein [Streptomyces sp. NPDC127049]|uniref:phospholipase domain-containing protein n=1 Tax=Streptomyces sp. NPDC127049 TaxID=3347118 RepID=UPI003668841F
MTGPNRFLRRFIGDASKAGRAIEVAARFAVEPGSGKTAVRFRLTNTSGGPVTFTIRSHAYRTDGPWTCTVTAGSSREGWFDAVTYADGWYDFTVPADVDGTWSRLYTGHIETGTPSVTG